MDRWLEGNLTGVDPRTELALLRDAVERACAQGRSVAPLIHALAGLDPVACVELVAGARALSEPPVIHAALAILDDLTPIMPAPALYRRLLVVAPELYLDIQRSAVLRYASESWAWTLKRSERPPGATALGVLLGSSGDSAFEHALAHGLVDAVLQRAAGGEIGALRALVAHGQAEPLATALSSWLESGHPGPVVAWIAAWWGPEIEPIIARASQDLTSEAALNRLISESHPSSALHRTLSDRLAALSGSTG